MISIQPLFSIPLLISTDNDFRIDMEHIESIPFVRMKNDAADWSESMTVLDLPQFKDARALAESHLKTYFHQVLQITENIEPHITSSWIVKMNPGDHGVTHHHTNSICSGVMYLDVDDNCGEIRFFHNEYASAVPPLFNMDIKSYNQFNSKAWACLPKPGMIVLFPSDIRHCVGQNKSDTTRYSLAFNSFIKGKLGSASDVLEIL